MSSIAPGCVRPPRPFQAPEPCSLLRPRHLHTTSLTYDCSGRGQRRPPHAMMWCARTAIRLGVLLTYGQRQVPDSLPLFALGVLGILYARPAVALGLHQPFAVPPAFTLADVWAGLYRAALPQLLPHRHLNGADGARYEMGMALLFGPSLLPLSRPSPRRCLACSWA